MSETNENSLVRRKVTVHGKAWIRTGGPNIRLEGKGFHISFNPDTRRLGEGWAGDIPTETALCKDGRYYILNGDFRKEYESLVDKGFKACKDFHDSKEELHSTWSND